MTALLWALVATAAYVAAFPPIGLSPVAFLVPVALCGVARNSRGWRCLAVGYAVGVGTLGVGCSWLSRTAWVNLVAMTVAEALWFAAAVVALRALLVRGRWPAMAAVPSVWVAMEWGRRHVPLDGFPWLFLGYSQAETALIQLAEFGGVWLLTAVVGFGGGALDDLRHRAGRRLLFGGTAVLVLLAAWGWCATHDGPSEEGERLPPMLLLQPNIVQSLRNEARDGGEAPSMFERHLEETARGLEEGPVALVIWSETMFPAWVVARSSANEFWPLPDGRSLPSSFAREKEREFVGRALAAAPGADLLVGAITYGGEGDAHRLWNSAVLYDQQGRRLGLYDKTYLVPGGEYLPWVDDLPASIRDAIVDFVRSVAGFVPALEAGHGMEVVEWPREGRTWRLGVTICYDIVYPSLGRDAVHQGADVLVNLSNEAWYPDSAEFAQYTAMAAVRAVETRRSMVRCTNSGTSAWIDPWGRVTALEQDGRRHGIAGTLRVEPVLDRRMTLYVRWGDWVAWAGVAVTLLGLLWAGRPSPSLEKAGGGGVTPP